MGVVHDRETVYLVNHPTPPDGFEPVAGMGRVWLGAWTAQFNGNTNLNFAGEEMGILNLETIDPTTSLAKVTALMAHEIFHAYQVKNNLICYSELLFFRYPYTQENLAYRVEEREALLRAVYAKDSGVRLKHLSRFVAWREKRAELLGELINYDMGVETLEGTATYVEYQAVSELSGWPEEFILARYCQSMAGYPEDLKNFRHSCFPTGLLISLLLDQFWPAWQREYSQTGGFLYELLREQLAGQLVEMELEVEDWSRVEALLAREWEKKEQDVQEFRDVAGQRVVIKGILRVRRFDPMNITVLEGQILHKRILQLQYEQEELMIRGQSLATFAGDDVMKVAEVVFYLQEPPVCKGNLIKLEGVGEIRGQLVEEGEGFTINLN